MVGSLYSLNVDFIRADSDQGPIIRINPNEVHVSDPELVDTVYPAGYKKVNKDEYFMSAMGYVFTPSNHFLTNRITKPSR
jgi:hypothetical protein